MPKIKNKKKSYVIVSKKNSINIYGAFPRTRVGMNLAKEYIEKIQKEHVDKLFIEKR